MTMNAFPRRRPGAFSDADFQVLMNHGINVLMHWGIMSKTEKKFLESTSICFFSSLFCDLSTDLPLYNFSLTNKIFINFIWYKKLYLKYYITFPSESTEHLYTGSLYGKLISTSGSKEINYMKFKQLTCRHSSCIQLLCKTQTQDPWKLDHWQSKMWNTQQIVKICQENTLPIQTINMHDSKPWTLQNLR